MSKSIKTQPGLEELNPYVPGKPIEQVQKEYGLKDVIKLASNENPIGPSPLALASMREALAGLNRYPDGDSLTLRKALAEKLDFPVEQITVGNGADGLIMEVCLAFVDKETEVIVSESSFPIYDIYTRVMRGSLVKTPLKEFSLDLDAMANAITEKTKLIFLCNPNNPTGTIVTKSEVGGFLRKVPDHALVIFDEAYFEMVDSDEYPNGLDYLREGRQNVMVMRSFSKVYGIAGIRLGYGAANSEIVTALHTVKEAFAVSALAQAAGLAALNDTDFLKKSIEKNQAGRLYLYAEFERLGLFFIKSHTNFILTKIGPNATDVIQKLLERGVIVRPCVGYALPEFLRISVGNESENIKLIETLEQVLRD